MSSPRWVVRSRGLFSTAMLALTGLCAFTAVTVLLGILGCLLFEGIGALNWGFLTRLPVPVGEAGGGIANALVGSAKLVILAVGLAAPPALLGAVYLSEWRDTRLASAVRAATSMLNSVPSIVAGLFVYGTIVVRQRHFSTFAGGVALAILLLPMTLQAAVVALEALPDSLREAALAVGASRLQMLAGILLPAAAPSLLSAVLVAAARIAGETAPLLFTAFNNSYWSPGWNQPTASLPVTIYTYSISPYDDWHRQAWAAAAVLLLAVVTTSLITRGLLHARWRSHERS
jgi:phosphate transport system permease protein